MSKLYTVKNPAPQGAGIRAFISMPTGSGFLQCPAIQSLIQSTILMQQEGIAYEIFFESGNCHVDDTRNSAVKEFLTTDATHLFFIDADVGFDPNALIKLLKSGRDMVAGVYPKKQDDDDYPVIVIPGDLQADSEGFVEVESVPTGFLCIKRNVIETLYDKEPRKFAGQSKEGEKPYAILFERTYESGNRFSGDYAFCRKWKKVGGKIYVDPEIAFAHEGLKEWTGVLGDYWRKKYGVTEMRFNAAIERLKNGDSSPELFVWLYDGWGNPYAAQPNMLAAVYHMARKTEGNILECGSGLTSIVLACAAHATGKKVVSLEHEMGWYTSIYRVLEINKLNIDLTFAPITDYDGFQWYKEPDKLDYSLVICDGPQRKYGRKGLFKLLSEQIKNATVIMDDTDDKKQMDLLKEWANGREIKTVGRFSVCGAPK